MRHPFDGNCTSSADAATQAQKRNMLKKAAAALVVGGVFATQTAFAFTTMALGETGGSGSTHKSRPGVTKQRVSKQRIKAQVETAEQIALGNSHLKSGRLVQAYEVYAGLFAWHRKVSGSSLDSRDQLGKEISGKAEDVLEKADTALAEGDAVSAIADCLEISKFGRLPVGKLARKKLSLLRKKKAFQLACQEVKARLKYRDALKMKAEIDSSTHKEQMEIHIRYKLKYIVNHYAETPTGKKVAADLNKSSKTKG